MTNSLEKYLALPPKKHDMMLPDIDDKELRAVGVMMGIEYLSEGSFSPPFFPVYGKITGVNNRPMVSLVCRNFDKPNAPIVNVLFMVSLGFGCTFVNEKTMNALAGSDDVHTCMDVAIQDPNFSTQCRLSHSHFKEANILGIDDMLHMKVSIEGMNWKTKSFRLVKQ